MTIMDPSSKEYLHIQQNYRLDAQEIITKDGVTYCEETRKRQAEGWERVAQVVLLVFATLTAIPLIIGLCFDLSRRKIKQWFSGEDVRILRISQKKTENSQNNFILPIQPTSTPTSKFNRQYPPVAIFDTRINGQGAHGTALCFKDSDILIERELVQPTTYDVPEFGKVLVRRVGNDNIRVKHVLQQQATRSCTAAVTAMLALDLGKTPNLERLFTTNLGNSGTMAKNLEECNLKPRITKIKIETQDKSKEIFSLQRLVNSQSAIVSINEPGGHVIIVDHISFEHKCVSIRDPYHGWAIIVTLDAFRRCWDGGDVIQAELDQLADFGITKKGLEF